MSDTISKYWENNDTFAEDTRKELQRMIDSDPNYHYELDSDDVRKRSKINKTAYRIVSEYDEKDILQAAYLIRKANSERGLEWDVTD